MGLGALDFLPVYWNRDFSYCKIKTSTVEKSSVFPLRQVCSDIIHPRKGDGKTFPVPVFLMTAMAAMMGTGNIAGVASRHGSWRTGRIDMEDPLSIYCHGSKSDRKCG